MEFRWDILLRYQDQMLQGFLLTFWVSVFTILLGFVLGNTLAYGRSQESPRWLRAPLSGFAFSIRGTPLLVQLYLFYYGLGQFNEFWQKIDVLFFLDNVSWTPLYDMLNSNIGAAMFVILLSTTCYSSEFFLGGLRSVPQSELEAIQAFNIKRWRRYRIAQLPHSLAVVWRTSLNESIQVAQLTTLISLVGVTEFFRVMMRVRQQTYNEVTPLVATTAAYFALSLMIYLVYQLARFAVLRHRRRGDAQMV